MNKFTQPLPVFSQIRDNCVVAISGFNLATTPEYLILELYKHYEEFHHPKNIFIVSDALPATPNRALDFVAENLYRFKPTISTWNFDALSRFFSMAPEACP